MKFIDTHAHLTFEPIYGQVDSVLNRAAQDGVETVLVPAYDLASWEKIDQLCRTQPAAVNTTGGILAAYGLHPWKAHENLDMASLAHLLRQPRAVAMGEIGLDFKIEQLRKERQTDVFRMQLELAVELDVPVMLHCRGAFMEMLEILKQYDGKVRGVVHGFSRGPDIVDEFLKLGLLIGFGGAITRPNAKRARQSASHVPLKKIVLETDCPSIGLDGVVPEDTEPKHVADIANVLASLRGVGVDEVATRTTQNALDLFGL